MEVTGSVIKRKHISFFLSRFLSSILRQGPSCIVEFSTQHSITWSNNIHPAVNKSAGGCSFVLQTQASRVKFRENGKHQRTMLKMSKMKRTSEHEEKCVGSASSLNKQQSENDFVSLSGLGVYIRFKYSLFTYIQSLTDLKLFSL